MNALTHEQFRAYLHLGREQLQAGEQAALDAHLADCAACRAYAADVATFQARLGRLMRLRWDHYQPSPALNEQVQSRLRRQQRRRQFWQFSGSALATVALVALGVALGWLVGRVGPLPERPAGPAVTPVMTVSPLQGGNEGGPGAGLVTFGNNFRLLAYTLKDNPIPIGGQTSATLYWQARDLTPGYSLFIHILDPYGNLVAQMDLPLDQNSCATTRLLPQGMFATCLPFSLLVAPGQYKVAVGIYDPATGQRLATDKGEVVVQLTTITVAPLPEETPTAAAAQFTCPVTRPNGDTPPGETSSANYHGNGELWTALSLDGKLAIHVEEKPGIHWPWWQRPTGQLTITGRRLGVFAPPLQAKVLKGTDETGPQSSELFFSTEGCWEITGKVGNAELSFVILVVDLQ